MTGKEAAPPTGTRLDEDSGDVRKSRGPLIARVSTLLEKGVNVAEARQPAVHLMKNAMQTLWTPNINNSAVRLKDAYDGRRVRLVHHREDVEDAVSGTNGEKVPSVGQRKRTGRLVVHNRDEFGPL